MAQQLVVKEFGEIVYLKELGKIEKFNPKYRKYNAGWYFDNLMSVISKYLTTFELVLEVTTRSTLMVLPLDQQQIEKAKEIRDDLLFSLPAEIEQIGLEKTETGANLNILDFLYEFHE
ncbi:MAG: hypothetical protein FWF46_08195 [Oscillospiraceae bacterium]|nr:hypothetical protein [Oscillospiraceae bacterium]